MPTLAAAAAFVLLGPLAVASALGPLARPFCSDSLPVLIEDELVIAVVNGGAETVATAEYAAFNALEVGFRAGIDMEKFEMPAVGLRLEADMLSFMRPPDELVRESTATSLREAGGEPDIPVMVKVEE